jgi:hypothetical protein
MQGLLGGATGAWSGRIASAGKAMVRDFIEVYYARWHGNTKHFFCLDRTQDPSFVAELDHVEAMKLRFSVDRIEFTEYIDSSSYLTELTFNQKAVYGGWRVLRAI